MAVAPSHFASAQSNSVAITINVGDLVIVLVNNADNTTPAGFADSGGNHYSLAFSDSLASRGSTAVYVCNKTAFSATSVSFTAGHSPSIVAGTFTGATGLGFQASTVGTSGTNISSAVTTKVANSYVAAFFTYIKSASTDSVSAATGTLQTSTGSTATVNGVGFITQAAATPGSFTSNVTAASAVTGYIIYSIEVWSLTYDSYFGNIPPKMEEQVVYKLIPTFAGGGGGGTPVTPVPVAVVLQGGVVGSAYSETVTANGGTGPYTYTLQSGSLPTGTTLSSGVISGTPTVAGTYSFTIKVTDSLGNVGSQNFQIVIASPSTAVGNYSWNA